jgi:hypothetical protein
MKYVVILGLLFALAACSKNNPNTNTYEPVCPQDAKICPDGSAVGRDINNKCQFFPCPKKSKP